jgi:hypothetical protein
MIEFHMGGVQTTLADPAFQTNPYTLRETGPDTNMFEVTVKMPTQVGGFPVEMGSTIEFRFNDHAYPTSVFLTVGSMGIVKQSTVSHLVPPILTVHATNSLGANVNYTNSTVLYGYQSPICDPASGSFFMMGKTTVTCAAKDQNGNSVIKSFVINIVPGQDKIPLWVKKPVKYWCGGDVDDIQLHATMKYLASNGVIIISGDSETLGQTPDKTMLCQWASGKVPDQEVAKSLYLLSQ